MQDAHASEFQQQPAAASAEQSSADATPAQAASAWGSWCATLAAALLGIAIIAVMGFAPGLLHDVSHDVRHTLVFPCH